MSLVNLTGRWHPDTISVQQHLGHHGRIVRWVTSFRMLVILSDIREIKTIHNLTYEKGQISLWKPIPHIQWKQKLLVWFVFRYVLPMSIPHLKSK
jgi:hypothetical protein